MHIFADKYSKLKVKLCIYNIDILNMALALLQHVLSEDIESTSVTFWSTLLEALLIVPPCLKGLGLGIKDDAESIQALHVHLWHDIVLITMPLRAYP